MLELALAAFEHVGLGVAVNRPFSGALVPMAFYRSDLRVEALMVEVNRRLYMDERTGERLAGFDELRRWLHAALDSIIAGSAAMQQRADERA